MKYLFAFIIVSIALVSCKTTEANYRAAYDKAVAARSDDDSDAESFYGDASRQLEQRFMMAGNDTVPVSVKMVTPVAEDGKAAAQTSHRFMIVVGQFKQKFNALSLKKRVAAAGYPDAFVVQTSEPYFYVVARSCETITEAAAALKDVKEKAPVAMKAPVPFILRDPR